MLGFPSEFVLKYDTRPFSIKQEDDPIRLKMKLVYNNLLDYGLTPVKISIALGTIRNI